MADTTVKLPAEINTATRTLHTHLNALITSRLPLALPPHSSTPSVYLTGLIPFAHVYLAFERVWDTVCARPIAQSSIHHRDDLWVDVPLDIDTAGQRISPDPSPTSQESTATQLLGASQIAPPPEIAVLTLLRSLRPHGIARGERLRRDIAALAGIALDEVDSFLAEHRSGATELFVEHIESSAVSDRPHVLLAYAFVLNMAIFSGGRWIRSVLAGAGLNFWSADDGAVASPPASPGLGATFGTSVHEKLRSFSLEQQDSFENLGLGFWFWSSPDDGVDIKTEFKRRLDEFEGLLTGDMRKDVVAEAREIFVRCEGLVGELDETVGRQGEVVQGLKSREMVESRETEKTVVLEATKVVNDWWPRMEKPGYIGLALAISSVSWYAMYHAGLWDSI